MAEGKAVAPAAPSCRGGPPAGHRRGRCGSGGCGLGRLVRKLRRQSKMLCTAAARPGATTFRSCQYDPLSYARNFDRNGFGTGVDDDSSHFYKYTFSSRFVLASSTTSRQPQ